MKRMPGVYERRLRNDHSCQDADVRRRLWAAADPTCPLCEGSGELVMPDVTPTGVTCTVLIECHACKGTGVVS